MQTVLPDMNSYVWQSGHSWNFSHVSRVFNNPYLMDVILQEFVYTNPSPSRQQNLLNAALTSKAFLNPAMDVLWRLLTSLIPVVNLLPEIKTIMLKYDNDAKTRKYKTSSFAFKEEDLARIDYYCCRVRTIRLRGNKNSGKAFISSQIYFLLDRYRRSRLFPSLRTFVVANVKLLDFEDLPGMYLCLAPSVSEVRLDVSTISEGNIIAYLSQLCAMKYQSLKVLHLTGDVSPSCLSSMDACTTLEKLNISANNVSVNDILPLLYQNTGLRTVSLSYNNITISSMLTSNCHPTMNNAVGYIEHLVELELELSSQRGTSSAWNVVAYITLFTPRLKTLTVIELKARKGVIGDTQKDTDISALSNGLPKIVENTPLLESFKATIVKSVNSSVLRKIEDWEFLKRLKLTLGTVNIDTKGLSRLSLCIFTGLPCLETLKFKAKRWEGLTRHEVMTLLNSRQIAEGSPKLRELALILPYSCVTKDLSVDTLKECLFIGNNESSALHHLRDHDHRLEVIRICILVDEYDDDDFEVPPVLLAEWISFVFPWLEDVKISFTVQDVEYAPTLEDYFLHVQSILHLLIKHRKKFYNVVIEDIMSS